MEDSYDCELDEIRELKDKLAQKTDNHDETGRALLKITKDYANLQNEYNKLLETVNENNTEATAQLAEDNGIGLKEHNADYLTHEQLSYRKMAKVHAVNIAPQLGVVQTKLLYSMSQKYGLHTVWNNFAQLVLDSGKWKKWTHSQNPNTKIAVGGHYCFSSDEYKRLIDKLRIVNWDTELLIAMTNLFELYTDL